MMKGMDGLGIQITGGRGSRRSPHAIIVARVEEGGSAHRYELLLSDAVCVGAPPISPTLVGV